MIDPWGWRERIMGVVCIAVPVLCIVAMIIQLR
jgi:hypothetical protein